MAQLKPGRSSAIPLAMLLAITSAFGATSVALMLKPGLAQSSGAGSFSLPAAVPSGTQVAIASSSSIRAINQELRQRFTTQYGGTNVTVNYVSTDAALQALRSGTVDLAAIGRSLTAAEKAQGLVEVPIARHKIAAVVSVDNPFSSSLTSEQFAGIFQGSITDWSQLGRAPGAIRSVDRPDSSDTRQTLQNYDMFRATPTGNGANVMKLAQDNTEMMINELGRDGIGYAIAEQVSNRPGVRILPIYDVLPNDPGYSYSQPLVYVYQRANPSAAAQAFLGFATDASNRPAIEAARVVDATTPATAIAQTSNGGAIAVAPATAPISSPPSGTTAVPAPGVVGSSTDPAVLGEGVSPVAPSASPGTPATSVPFVAPNSLQLNSPPPNQATAPATTDSEVGQSQTGQSGATPWWLWWLALPILGGLLWWLIRGGGDSDETPIPLRPLPVTRASRLILTPRNCQDAYASWELSPADQEAVKQHPGQHLVLRLYDVTGLDLEQPLDQQIPHSVQEFACDEHEQDFHLPIAVDDRDYLAELGVSSDNHWLALARSPHVRVPACKQTEPELWPSRGRVVKSAAVAEPTAIATAATTAAITAATATTAAAVAKPQAAAVAKRQLSVPIKPITPNTRLVLAPRNGTAAYASWEIVAEHKAALKRQGGETLALRLYDVTGLDLSRQSPKLFQQFDCDEAQPNRHISVPLGDRDYIAQLGYVTEAGRWLKLAQSDPVRVSSASL